MLTQQPPTGTARGDLTEKIQRPQFTFPFQFTFPCPIPIPIHIAKNIQLLEYYYQIIGLEYNVQL